MTSVSRPGKQEAYSLLIDGKPATPREMKRILNTRALPAKNDRASKPLLNVARPFSILKRG